MTLVLHASTYRHEDGWAGPKRYIRIVIHDHVIEFRKAAARYRPWTDWSESAGAFCPAPDKEKYDRKNDELIRTPPKHWAGLMRLSMDYLSSEVVAHECFHAAAAIYRMDVKDQINLGYGCAKREEQLAYIVGDVFGAVSGALQDAGVWEWRFNG